MMEAEESTSSMNASSDNDDTCTAKEQNVDRSDHENNATETQGEGVDEEAQQEEDEEEQLLSSFPEEEDSRSSATVRPGIGDEEESMDKDNEEDNQPSASDENCTTNETEVCNNNQTDGDEGTNASLCDESNDSTSKGSNISNESGPTQDPALQETSLLAEETLEDFEDGDSENLVSEVDITAMMEMNMDVGSQENSHNNDEPEIIALDSDEEDSNNKKSKNSKAPEFGLDRVFQIDADENVTELDVELDVASMMEVNLGDISENSDSNSSALASNRRPKRAAAAAAAKTIYQISTNELETVNVFRHRRKSQEDIEFFPNIDDAIPLSPSQPSIKQHRCHICKKLAACSIVVKHFGSDVYLCSNSCFKRFRNHGRDFNSKSLPCSKCSLMDEKPPSESYIYFWETMNFCSDLCVGRYQMDVGSKCCTCGKSVPWNSLGKYCVRFGSDIRQFCVPQCLEEYKKNARVCFNCQLDIRRVGNVILANIPSKSTPKEFCSQDCVDMYCERNLHQPTRAKPMTEHFCFSCNRHSLVYKELILAAGTFKTCSESCWNSVLQNKGVTKAEKCEMCAKYVNMDLGFTTPVFWVSTMLKVFGFCSHACKNLYILSARKILSCTSCKVKKYNFDLIEFFTNASSTYAVCSLACLPKTQAYLNNIREVLYLPQPTSDKNTVVASRTGSGQLPNILHCHSSKSRQRGKNSESQSYTSSNLVNVPEVQIGNTDNILDILTIEEIMAIVEELRRCPKKRSVMCSAKPKTRTIETQTDISELNQIRMIPLKPPESDSNIGTTEAGKQTPGVEVDPPENNQDSRNDANTAVSSCSDAKKIVEKEARTRLEKSALDNQVLGFQNIHTQSGSSQQSNSISNPTQPKQLSLPTDVNVPSSNIETPSAISGLHKFSNSPLSQNSCCSPFSSIEAPQQFNPTVIKHPILTPSPSATQSSTGDCYLNASGRPSETQPSPIHLPTSSSMSPSPTMPIGYGTHYIGTLGYNRPPLPVTTIAPLQTARNRVDFTFRAWKLMFGYSSDPRHFPAADLCYKLHLLATRGLSTNGQKYPADSLLYICLGIQQLLTEANRVDRIFYDNIYYNYVVAWTDIAEREHSMGIHGTVDELDFWETLELGASSPGVLLFTLIYMFMKYFGLKSWEMHSALQFGHIILQSRYNQFSGKFVKYLSILGLPGACVTEIPENLQNPTRCLIKVYEFYCYKSEIRDGPFYKCLRQDYTPRSPWFTREPLNKQHIYQMLIRASMVKTFDCCS